MSLARASHSSVTVNTGGACLCLCGLKFKPSQKDECPGHLENWHLWMRRRKRMHERLAKKLECAPGDLAMNSGDYYRTVKEEKDVLEYSRIETRFDKYRGNPEFWRLPYCLKDREPPYGGTEYFAVKSREEKNEIPEIEYVAVPDAILEEKDVLPRTRQLKSLWGRSGYRKQFLARMAEKIMEIEPHKPDLSELIIVGSKIAPGIDKTVVDYSPREVAPSRTTTPTEPSAPLTATSHGKVFIKINNVEFGDNCKRPNGKFEIPLLFEYFKSSTAATERWLQFENCGLTSLRIYWSPYKKMKIFREFADTSHIFHPFKFDKNELILLPGAKKQFPIWFREGRPGNYFEQWEITTLPQMWDSDFHLLITLKGYVFNKFYDEQLERLSERLAQRARNTIVKDTLTDVINRGIYTKSYATPLFTFSEKQLFESRNASKFLYDAKIVKKLKEFYETIKFPGDSPAWNLSVRRLREVARKRDLYTFFEKKLTMYDNAKMKRQLLLDNFEQSQKIDKEPRKKGVKTKDNAPDPVKIIQETSCYRRLYAILQTLEAPSMRPHKQRTTYLFVYVAMRTFLWKILTRLDNSSEWREINSSVPQPVDFPDRFVFEKFDERYVERTKRTCGAPKSSHAKPKSVLSRGIPAGDVKKLFKIYFTKEESDQKKPKRNNAEAAKKVTKGLKSKKNVEEDENLDKYDEYFDPFSENVDFPPAKAIGTTTFNSTTSEIDRAKYLIVYTILGEFLDHLVETIEERYDEEISSATLAELQACTEQRGREKNDDVINETVSLSNKSRIESDLEYLEFLQTTHWRENMNTKKFYVAEEKMELAKAPPEDEIREVRSLANVFSLGDFQRKEEPWGLKDGEVQTDVTQKIEWRNYEPERKASDVESVGSEAARNIFYFLEDSIDDKESEITMTTISIN